MSTKKKKSVRKAGSKKSATKKKAAVKKSDRKPAKKAPAKAKKKAAGKSAAKKAAPKKAAAKKAAAKKAASKKAPVKPAGKKATAKAASAKAAAAPAQPVIEGVARTQKKKKKKALTRNEVAAIAAKGRQVAEPRHPKLGVKYVCFQCEAKFYDLNRPEPTCPKCGADQRERPKAAPAPKPAARKRKAVRPMAPLLDDDDEGPVPDDDELGLGAPKIGDDLFDDAASADMHDED